MVVVKDHQQREPSISDITTIGLDLAKNVFQVHAVDVAGSVVLRRRLRRSQVLALPSCSKSATSPRAKAITAVNSLSCSRFLHRGTRSRGKYRSRDPRHSQLQWSARGGGRRGSRLAL